MKGLPLQYYNNNYYQQPQVTTARTLKGYPVSSIEEVRAAPIDFDGTVFFFPDLINQKIYTKQINLDGTARLNVYDVGELPKPPKEIDTTNFVTKDDLNTALNNLLDQITMPRIRIGEQNESN